MVLPCSATILRPWFTCAYQPGSCPGPAIPETPAQTVGDHLPHAQLLQMLCIVWCRPSEVDNDKLAARLENAHRLGDRLIPSGRARNIVNRQA